MCSLLEELLSVCVQQDSCYKKPLRHRPLCYVCTLNCEPDSLTEKEFVEANSSWSGVALKWTSCFSHPFPKETNDTCFPCDCCSSYTAWGTNKKGTGGDHVWNMYWQFAFMSALRLYGLNMFTSRFTSAWPSIVSAPLEVAGDGNGPESIKQCLCYVLQPCAPDLRTNFFVSPCNNFSKKRRHQICCAAIITSINVLAFQNHRRWVCRNTSGPSWPNVIDFLKSQMMWGSEDGGKINV